MCSLYFAHILKRGICYTYQGGPERIRWVVFWAHFALNAFKLGARKVDSFKNIAGIRVTINFRREPPVFRWQMSYSLLKLQLYT
jgi:hypothetical protein